MLRCYLMQQPIPSMKSLKSSDMITSYISVGFFTSWKDIHRENTESWEINSEIHKEDTIESSKQWFVVSSSHFCNSWIIASLSSPWMPAASSACFKVKFIFFIKFSTNSVFSVFAYSFAYSLSALPFYHINLLITHFSFHYNSHWTSLKLLNKIYNYKRY